MTNKTINKNLSKRILVMKFLVIIFDIQRAVVRSPS